MAALLKDVVSEQGSDKVLVKANRVFHLARYKSVVKAGGYIGSWLISTDDTLHYTLSEFKHCRTNVETDSLAERLLADVPAQLHYASAPLMYRDFATAARLLPAL